MKPLVAACLLLFLIQTPQAPIPTEELSNILPVGASVDQFTRTSDGQRTYYSTPSGEVWLYDRAGNKTTRILTGTVWDLSVSPMRDALAYTKSGQTRREQYVFVQPLDPKTGLASGNERRLSARTGDLPSISPDGKWVAFARDDSTGVGQSVVAVAIGGGNERVVASGLPASIGNIRWTPDARTLFFGVNPPVPFTCAESCLSVPANLQNSGTIRRVAVSGGPVTVVTATGNPSPGLSPDGTRLVFADTAGLRQFVVADASGQRMNTFTLPPGQTQQGWSGNSTLMTVAGGTIRRLRSVSIADGSSRVLFDTDGFVLAPAFSPDGKTVAFLRAVGDRCEARIMNVDGTQPKAVMLPDRGCGDSLTWTSDQRSLIYTQYFPPDRRMAITMVEIATGQGKQLHESRPGDMNWVLDADAVIVSELPGAAGPQRRVSFSRVDLDGKATLLRDLLFDEPTGSLTATLDRATAMVLRATPASLRLIPLDGNGAERAVTPATKGYVLPRFTISADKQWAGFRISPSGADASRLNMVELVRLDQSDRRTVELPFFAHGQNTMLILPGARELIVTERPSPTGEPGVYVVNVTTRSVRKLFAYVPQGRLPEMVLSPDGRTLLALITETMVPTVSAMDLSRTK